MIQEALVPLTSPPKINSSLFPSFTPLMRSNIIPMEKVGINPEFVSSQLPKKTKNELLHEDVKARNRVAAKKWRTKKDNLLSELEAENDKLRISVLNLISEQNSISVENRILEQELQYFQVFMTKIMNQPEFHNLMKQ